jgi:hypothetical protein
MLRLGWVIPLALLTVSNLRAAENVVTPAMVGHWEGHARIVVSWCRQKRLPVKLDLHADGTVAGTVGDATLQHGHFRANRGWLGRKLHLATDYIIAGDLDGDIVAAEGIRREHVMIPLNFNGGVFKGGVNTSGSTFGGKESMWLAAMALELVRSP